MYIHIDTNRQRDKQDQLLCENKSTNKKKNKRGAIGNHTKQTCTRVLYILYCIIKVYYIVEKVSLFIKW